MTQQFSKELFEEQLEIGSHYESLVASRLQNLGINCITPNIEEEFDINEPNFYTKYQKDLLVPPSFIIEVKSRNLYFTSPYTFPFPDFVLETVWGWNQKVREPNAIVIVSQHSKYMLVVNVEKTKHLWTKRRQWDGLRQIESYEYFIPKTCLQDFNILVEYLKNVN